MYLIGNFWPQRINTVLNNAMKKMNDKDIFSSNFGDNVQGREGVIAYEYTSHPFDRKT